MISGGKKKRRKNPASSTSSCSSASRISSNEMEIIIIIIIDKLLCSTVRDSTKQNYISVWRLFNSFLVRLDKIPRDWEDRAKLFCAFLGEKGNKSQTIKSYISAIKSIVKMDKYPWDDNKLLLSSITRACRLKNDSLSCRLPIQKGLFEMLLFEVPRIYDTQPYLTTLYQAIFCLLYYGLMRIGEVTKSIQSINDHSIKNHSIHVGKNKDKILVILYSSKTHDESDYPQQIKISSLKEDEKHKKVKRRNHSFFCPFSIIRRYIDNRQGFNNPPEQNFFVFSDGSPVRPTHVRAVLKTSIANINLDPTLYNCHSMHAGMATDMLKAGVPVEKIRYIGRWKSNAIYRYLRH